ncbi:MAG: flavodoxin family protein [Candidatus Hodarchaeaceae archaeon]|nr:flavodoxin family protein [Candidatus Hodarchaeaceae archaeon]
MTKKTVLALAGSPVKGGSTDRLLDQVLRGTRTKDASVEKIYLCDLKITPCNSCGKCEKTGVCPIDDDMKWLYKKLLKSHVIILASPIYFMGLPAQAKSMIDRCQSIWVERFKLKKKFGKKDRMGFFISVGNMTRPHLFKGAVATVKAFFATIGVKYTGDLLFPKINGKKDIMEHPTAMSDALEAGAKLVSD